MRAIAFGHPGLDFEGAADGVNHAAELNERAVARALHDPAMMHGDGRVEQIAAQRPQPRKGALLVRAGEAGETDDVGDEDRREFPALSYVEFPKQDGLAVCRDRRIGKEYSPDPAMHSEPRKAGSKQAAAPGALLPDWSKRERERWASFFAFAKPNPAAAPASRAARPFAARLNAAPPAFARQVLVF